MRNSRIGYICLISPHYVISNVSSNRLSEWMQSHSGCICLTFLHCAFSNVSSNRLSERMHSRTCFIYSTFLHCGFSNVSSNCLPQKRNSRIDYVCLISPHYVISNVSSNRLSERMHGHIGCICFTFYTAFYEQMHIRLRGECKKTRYFWEFFPKWGGGHSISQFFCKITKSFLACQIHPKMLKHVLQRWGGDI